MPWGGKLDGWEDAAAEIGHARREREEQGVSMAAAAVGWPRQGRRADPDWPRKKTLIQTDQSNDVQMPRRGPVAAAAAEITRETREL